MEEDPGSRWPTFIDGLYSRISNSICIPVSAYRVCDKESRENDEQAGIYTKKTLGNKKKGQREKHFWHRQRTE